MILKPSYSPSISLQTARLNLRPHEPNDLEDSYALWSDPNTTTFIGGRPFTREECWSRILRYIGLWPALGYGYWAMFEKDGGRFVGEVGFADFRRDLKPPLDGPEAGWAIMPWARGRGYATEGLEAALGWAKLAFSSDRVLCIINPDNVGSVKVACKVGFHRCGGAIYKESQLDIFERLLSSN